MVKRRNQLGEAWIGSARSETLRDTGCTARGQLHTFNDGIQNLFENLGSRVRGADEGRPDEVAGQGAACADERQR